MKKIIFFLTVFFLLFVIGNTIVSLVSLWSKKDLLVRTQKQLVREQQEHQKLLEQYQQVNTPAFLEEEARNKLFLGKPGDVEVILPTASVSGEQRQQIVGSEPVWLQWWNVFFGQ